MVKCSNVVFVIAALAGVAFLGCSKDEEPVPAPMLVFPANNAAFVPDTLTLTWNDTTGASSYSVQVSTNSGFSALAINTVSAAQSLAITSPLANNTTYFWRVNTSNGKQTSAWSGTFSFTTGVPAPVLTNPGIDVVCVPDTLTLAWNPIAGATRYYVQLSTDSAFSSYAINDSSVSTSLTVTSPLASSTDYFWKVSVLKPQGTSPWSNKRKFTTALKPAVTALVSPADGAGGVASPVTLTWNSSTGGTVTIGYHVQVSSSSDFASVAAEPDWLNDTTTAVSSLSSGLYYWRVAVKNMDCGIDGSWSAAWSFTIP